MNTQQVFERALRTEREGKYEEAYALFVQGLDAPDADPGDLYFHCGWCLENSPHGDKRRAIELYQKAVETTQAAVCRLNSMFRAGWLLMGEGEHAKAALFFRRAIDYGDLIDLKIDVYQNAVYWYAVYLEAQGYCLDALPWYRFVQTISPQLGPESKYRQILCQTRVGLFDQALKLCEEFDLPAPNGFSPGRYRELQTLAREERGVLRASLTQIYSPRKISSQAHAH